MIEKQLTTNDGTTYLVGFKEIGSDNAGLECHILERGKIRTKSIYCKTSIKGLAPDYKQIALNTIYSYEEERKQKEKLLSEQW